MSGSLILPLALASSISRVPPPPSEARARVRVRLRADEVADPPIEVAGHGARAGRRVRPAGAGTQTGTLEHQRGVGDGPTVVHATDGVVVTDAHVGEEHLVEHRAARHLLERADVDAGLVDVAHEVGDPLVLRDVGIGAGEEHADVGDLRARRPHLLPVDDPLVAVRDRRGGEAGEVGAGARLAEELAPRLAAGDGVADVALLLLVGAVHRDRGRRQQRAEPHRRAQRPELVDGLLDADAVLTREALAVPLGRERGERPPGAAEPVPPLTDGEVGVPVLLEPARDLVDDVDARVGDVDHGSPCGGGVAPVRKPGTGHPRYSDGLARGRVGCWVRCRRETRSARSTRLCPKRARRSISTRSGASPNRTRRGSAGGDGSTGAGGGDRPEGHHRTLVGRAAGADPRPEQCLALPRRARRRRVRPTRCRPASRCATD